MKNALHYNLIFEMSEDSANLENEQVLVDNLSLSEWRAIKDEIDAIVLALEAIRQLEKYRNYV